MKKLTTTFLMSFLLIGCTPKVIITPDKLPDAIIGEIYYVEIEINGGTGRVSSNGVKSIITPYVLVVQSNPKAAWGDNNRLVIHGKPVTTETITVKIKGNMAPSFFNSNPKFEKTYIIKVKESE